MVKFEHDIGFHNTCAVSVLGLQFTSRLKLSHILFESGYTLGIEQRVERIGRLEGRELHVSGRLDVRSSNMISDQGCVEIITASCDEKLVNATVIKEIDEQVILISTPFAAD
ncbi:hypothetical protein E4U32_007813 [Claviceps aff. humidiphila group G2b]|nr:hypothetical protein E4U32_007813 [Claviceps aff. humidiphila group G2b]